MVKTFTPSNEAVVSLRNERMRLFFDMYEAREDYFNSYTDPWSYVCVDKDGSHPAPVLFSWITDINTEQYDFAVHISADPDFADEIVIENIKATAVEKYNLEIGRRYYWYVENRGECPDRSEVSAFDTADEFPRAIYISPQNTNTRDAGGIFNIDGRRVKQGLLYRGANIDKARDKERTPSEDGIRRIVEELHIKTDLDLRGQDFTEPPKRHPGLEHINRVMFDCGSYENTVKDEVWREANAKLFRFMCDESIYPAYIHCHAGTDRTGTAMFYLGLLLRINIDILARDFEFSALCSDGWIGRKSAALTETTVAEMRLYCDEGDDVYTCAEKYFARRLGLPDVPEKLRSIFLEP